VYDINISNDGFALALGHLYGNFSLSYLSSECHNQPLLLKSVFASSNLLGLTDLAHATCQLIKDSVNQSTILDYAYFVNSFSADYNPELADDLKAAVFDYLTRELVKDLKWSDKTSEEYSNLVSVYAGLPFEWLKKVVESTNFPAPSDMERYYILY
jgi:hypothetical protein